MRGRIIGYLAAAAGFLWTLAAPHYMSAAPSIVARIAFTGVGVALWLILAWALFKTRQRPKAKRMEYAIVGGVAAISAMVVWWALGLVPAEAVVAPPDLTAEVQADGGEYFIVVTNSGTEAVVWADIRIEGRHYFDGGSDQRVYKGYWENSRAATTTLRPGQQDRLVVGGVTDSVPWVARADSPPSGSSAARLHFVFYEPNTGARGDILQYWAGGTTPTDRKPILFLGITLKADPKLAADLNGVYLVTMDGLVVNQPMSPASP